MCDHCTVLLRYKEGARLATKHDRRDAPRIAIANPIEILVVSARLASQQQRASDAIRNVIMAAWRVIDRVAPPACCAPFQRYKLGRKPGYIEQLDPPAVQRRKQSR